MTGCRNPSTSWHTCHSAHPMATHHRRMVLGKLVHNIASSLFIDCSPHFFVDLLYVQVLQL